MEDERETNEYIRMTSSFRKKGRQITVKSAKSEKNLKMCEPSLNATHVVTEVKYGFNAYMVFESQVTESYSAQDVTGALKVAVKLGLLSASGNGSINFSEEVEAVTKSLRFKFHGDTIIDPPPQTYQDAIDVYKLLPRRSIDNERVVSFSIAPLSDYCNDLAITLVDISNGNVETASNIVGDFETVNKMIRTLKNHRLSLDFQSYRAVLLDLEHRFGVFQSNFSSNLQTLLPLIRSGHSNETELTSLLEDYNKSPYEKEKFLGLLGTRQKEIETAEYIIYYPDLPSNTYIDFDHTGDMSKCIIGHDYTLSYELKILPKDISKLGDMYEKGNLDEGDKWFMKEDQVGENRPLLHGFSQLAQKNEEEGSASICFLISLTEIVGDDTKAFQLKLLKNGGTIIEGFHAPQKIQKMTETARGLDHVELTVYHEADNDLKLKTSHFELKAKYELISTDVINSQLLYLNFNLNAKQMFLIHLGQKTKRTIRKNNRSRYDLNVFNNQT